MRSNGQDRSRGDSHLQDVRVGRHRDKLELIRDSLKPFEQSAGEQSQPAMVTEQQRMMDALVAQGYDRDAAFYALKLVKFASTSAAIDVLKHINHDHAGPLGSSQDTRLLLSTVPTHPSNLLSNGNSQFNQNLKVSSYGNGASNGNLHPTLFPNSNIEDSSSSRSNSPLPPQLPSPTHQSTAYLGPSQINSVGMPSPSRPTRQFTPVAPDYHRSHVHLSTTPSYASDLYQQQLRSHQGGGKPTIYIEKGPDRSALAPKNHYVVRDSYKSPLEGSISAPLCQSTSQFHIGSGHGMTTQTQMNILGNSPHGAPGSYGSGSHPVIRTTFSAAPMRSMVNINVSPAHKDARSFRLDVSGRDGGVSSVHGVSGTVTGVQSIMVDPDQGRVFVGYEDELLPKSYSEAVPSTSNEAQISRHERQERTYGAVRGSVSPNQPVASQTHEQVENVTRSTSPLPELISTRIKQQKYERYMKPCQPRLFCFFMEQHVERLLQQYKERMKRSQQLQREMEAANLPEQMKQKMLDFLQQKESRYMRLRRQKMNKEMFEVIQHIGVGAFGRVSLVKKSTDEGPLEIRSSFILMLLQKDTGQVYAMKSLLKKDVILKHQAAHVKAERDILAEADSPWIVKLFFSFQDDRCLYFIMEYVPGGDMMQLLINTGIFEEKLARFYIAELTCAIEYVHSLGFIHRDIKPDNILIDQQGHIKLTDFGLCTGLRWTHDRRYYGPENDSQSSHARVDSLSLPPEVAGLEQHMKVLNIRHQKKRDQAHSVVGTGNYMAPEVIEKTGHTQLCDWWSVGVILYEMVFGRPPFMSIRDDPKETRHRIKNWQRYLDVSSSAGGGHLSRECINMICQLCCDKTDRIGSGGAREVMEHPWFRGIDFKNLRGTRAEFIPRVEHAEDTSNFDTIEITESPFETVGKRAPNNPAFYEFTFRHFFDTDGQGCPSLRPTQKRPSLAPLMEKRPMLPSVMETGSSHRHEAISSTESIVI